MAPKVVNICFALVRWTPVLFITAVIVWSYYAYVIQMCICKYSAFILWFMIIFYDFPDNTSLTEITKSQTH